MAAREFEFARKRDHGHHDLDGAVRGGPAQRPELRAKDLRLGERKPDAAHAKERICLMVEREAGNRLIGPGVEGANGHRLARRPFGEPPIGPILRLLVRQPALAAEQELGAHKTYSVANSGIQRFHFGGIGDIDADRDWRPVGGERGPRPELVRSASRRPRRSRARREILARRGLRIDGKRRARAVDERIRSLGDAAEIEGEADDHRHAARPREGRDMARGAAARQRNASAAAPIRGEKARRRQVFAHEDRSRGQAGVRRDAGQDPGHPVADVPQVACARLEMHVLGGFVAADFSIERRTPCAIGGDAGPNRGEGGF